MIGTLWSLYFAIVSSIDVSAASQIGTVETPINTLGYTPGIYNDNIGVQNVVTRQDGIYLRSTLDESAMVRWETPNPQDDWAFEFEFNEPNLDSRETASIYLFYTKEKPTIGNFKGGPGSFHGFVAGMEFSGKNIEIVHARNKGVDYSNLEDIVTVVDSLNPQRFAGIERLRFKVINTIRNFKVEIYNGNHLLYDNFRHFMKDMTEYAESGYYISIFADYKHVSSGKAFKLMHAQLYHREETADYDTSKVNMQKIEVQIRPKNEIKHHNTDIQDLVFKTNSMIAYIKAMIGELPETSIIKAEHELVKEVDSLYEKLAKYKSTDTNKKMGVGTAQSINMLDQQVRKITKLLNYVEHLLELRDENSPSKYRQIAEYLLIFVGIVGGTTVLCREVVNFTNSRKLK